MARTVEIHLSALTRVFWNGVVTVPDDATAGELEQLVDRLYGIVDGGTYENDNDFWERDECCHREVSAAPRESAHFEVRRGEDGSLLLCDDQHRPLY